MILIRIESGIINLRDFIGLIPTQHQLGKSAHITKGIIHHFQSCIAVESVVAVFGVFVFVIVRQTHCVSKLMNPGAVKAFHIAERPTADAKIIQCHTIEILAAVIAAGARPPVIGTGRAGQSQQQRIHGMILIRIESGIINLRIQTGKHLIHQAVRIAHIAVNTAGYGVGIYLALQMESAIGGTLIIARNGFHGIEAGIGLIGSEHQIMYLLRRIALVESAVGEIDSHQENTRLSDAGDCRMDCLHRCINQFRIRHLDFFIDAFKGQSIQDALLQ